MNKSEIKLKIEQIDKAYRKSEFYTALIKKLEMANEAGVQNLHLIGYDADTEDLLGRAIYEDFKYRFAYEYHFEEMAKSLTYHFKEQYKSKKLVGANHELEFIGIDLGCELEDGGKDGVVVRVHLSLAVSMINENLTQEEIRIIKDAKNFYNKNKSFYTSKIDEKSSRFTNFDNKLISETMFYVPFEKIYNKNFKLEDYCEFENFGTDKYIAFEGQ